jgi:hypothetical protein
LVEPAPQHEGPRRLLLRDPLSERKAITSKRVWLVAATTCALVLAAAGAWWKRPRPRPYDLLEGAQAAYDAHRDTEAERLFGQALDRAEAIGLGEQERRGFVDRVIQIHLVRDDLAEAERLAPTLFAWNPPDWSGDAMRVAHNMAVLHLRQGRPAKATPLLERILVSLERTGIDSDDPRKLRLLVLEQLDRCYTAQGRTTEAEPLSRRYLQRLDELGSFTGGRYPPLVAGLAPRVARYAAFLGASGRGGPGAEIAQLLGVLEARAPSPPLEGRCFTFYGRPPRGCLLDPD